MVIPVRLYPFLEWGTEGYGAVRMGQATKAEQLVCREEQRWEAMQLLKQSHALGWDTEALWSGQVYPFTCPS